MVKKLNFSLKFLITVIIILIIGKPAFADTEADVNLMIDGEIVAADVMPIIKDNRTLVPARAVFEGLGGVVEWDQNEAIITINYDSNEVILKINSQTAIVNGQDTKLDVPAALLNNRTLIPVRFVAEELGFLVEWENATRTVLISSPKEEEPEDDPTEEPEEIKNVTAVEIKGGSSRSENTIITINVSDPIEEGEDYTTFILDSPDRFVLDIKGFEMGKEISDKKYTKEDSPVSAIRCSTFEDESARIVCDLKEVSTPSVALSADKKTITISFKRLSSYFKPLEDGKLVVMLDPGHGESTGGKRSPDGLLREYEFNRVVAGKIKTILEAQGIEVLFTVSDNTDPSLSERCEKANVSDADILVSIHANAYGNGHDWTTPRGWEIYNYENSIVGKTLAESILEANNPENGLDMRGNKTANFYMIVNTYMPAVLIEHGFYTNVEEVELLKSDEWRTKVAGCDAEGIINFLKKASEE